MILIFIKRSSKLVDREAVGKSLILWQESTLPPRLAEMTPKISRHRFGDRDPLQKLLKVASNTRSVNVNGADASTVETPNDHMQGQVELVSIQRNGLG